MAEDRPPGILTRGDREYLLGEKDYKSVEAESNKRRAIRKRIRNGLLDFGLIERHLGVKDRDKIFEQAAQSDDAARADFVEAIELLISWLYLGLKKGGFNAKAIFESGIEIGESEFGIGGSAKIVQSEVNLNIRTREIEGVQQTIDKLESGKPVEAYQLYQLIQNDVAVDLDDVDEVVVFTNTSRLSAEKAIIRTIFSDYFDVDIKVDVMDPTDYSEPTAQE